jgi:hypothetical protein
MRVSVSRRADSRLWGRGEDSPALSITKAEKHALLTIGSYPNRKLRIKSAKVVYK